MSNKDYEVGYCKPPKSGQFKPGKSGNPAGRPKGTKDLATYFIDESQSIIEVSEAGVKQEMTKLELLIKTLFAKGIKGDARAATLLIKTLERVMPVEEADNSENPVSKSDEKLISEFLAKHGLKENKND